MPLRISIALAFCIAALCHGAAWTQLTAEEETLSKPERIMIAPDVIFVAQDAHTSHGGWYVAAGIAIVVLMMFATYMAIFGRKSTSE